MKRKQVQRILCAWMSGVFLAGSVASPLTGMVSMAAEIPAAEENQTSEDAQNAGNITAAATADGEEEETQGSSAGLAAGASKIFGGGIQRSLLKRPGQMKRRISIREQKT